MTPERTARLQGSISAQRLTLLSAGVAARVRRLDRVSRLHLAKAPLAPPLIVGDQIWVLEVEGCRIDAADVLGGVAWTLSALDVQHCLDFFRINPTGKCGVSAIEQMHSAVRCAATAFEQ